MAKPDWEAIESAYRAGALSLREIGAQYGVTEGAIRKRAKKLEWVRKGGTQVRKNGTQSGTQKSKPRTTAKQPCQGPEHPEPMQTDDGQAQENVGVLKAQHEQFAQNIAQGMGQKEAAICAGYSPTRAEAQASIMLKRPDVRQRIRELRQEAALLVTFNAKDLAELSFKSAKEALQDKKFGQVAPNIKNAAQLTGIDMSTNKTEVNVDLAGLSYGKVCIVTPATCPPEVWAAHMDKLREGKPTAQQ